MLSSVQKSIINTRSLMVSSYRSAQENKHALFATVQEVADYHHVSRKHLWELSVKLAANDENPVSLLPPKEELNIRITSSPKPLSASLLACVTVWLGHLPFGSEPFME